MKDWLDFDVVVATPGYDGRCWSSGPCTWTEGLNAEPEGWYRYHGRNKGCQLISKLVRSSTDWTRPTSFMCPLEKLLSQRSSLADNFQTLIEAINKAKPAALKGQYMRSVTLAPTMGPGVKLNPVKLA